MKLSILLTLLFTFPAEAGPRVGNGGGVWLCRDRGSLAIKWMRLTDLFEAETEFGYSIPSTGSLTAIEIYNEKVDFVRAHIPALNKLISPFLSADIWSKLQFTPKQGNLTVIDDGYYRVRPSEESCPDGYIYFGQLANYTNDDRILIGDNLWSNPALSETDRGALLVHELVYKTLRDTFNDRNSVRTREIVGILFAGLSVSKANQEIEKVLKKAAPEGEESGVSLFPVHVACSGQVQRGQGVKSSVVLTKMGNEMRAKIGGFSFFAEASNDDSYPRLMQIADASSGSISSIDASAIRPAFSEKSEIALSVQTLSREIATLSCWSEARQD